MGMFDFLKTKEERLWDKQQALRAKAVTSSTPPTAEGARPLPPKTPTEYSYRCTAKVRRNLAQQASVRYGETSEEVKAGVQKANNTYNEATSDSVIDNRRRRRWWG